MLAPAGNGLAAGCDYDRCRSPDGTGGVDCWGGAWKGCLCSSGRANVEVTGRETSQTTDGNTYHRFACCDDPGGVGVRCGDYRGPTGEWQHGPLGSYKITHERATHWGCVTACGPDAAPACIDSAEEDALVARMVSESGANVVWLGHYQRAGAEEPAGGWSIEVVASGEEMS